MNEAFLEARNYLIARNEELHKKQLRLKFLEEHQIRNPLDFVDVTTDDGINFELSFDDKDGNRQVGKMNLARWEHVKHGLHPDVANAVEKGIEEALEERRHDRNAN